MAILIMHEEALNQMMSGALFPQQQIHNGINKGMHGIKNT